jgi:predicted RNA-binding protein with PUA-like domain
MNYWIVKQEPTAYSWDDFVKDGKTDWTGVRNFKARNNLKEMKTGDKVYFYHSVVGKEIVGIAEVSKEAFPDPTDIAWHAVELKPVKAFKKTVTLEAMRANKALANIYLIRQITKDEYQEVLSMSK